MTEEIHWGKVLDLAACALSIASLPETLGMSAFGAMIACGKAAEDWWTE